jgi:hypothetical protein
MVREKYMAWDIARVKKKFVLFLYFKIMFFQFHPSIFYLFEDWTP